MSKGASPGEAYCRQARSGPLWMLCGSSYQNRTVYWKRFSESRRHLIADLGGEVRTILAYQKETVATALTLAGIERQELQDWRPRLKNGRVQSFLDGLSEAYLREDQMVINDLGTFPGFEIVRQTQHSTARVPQNDRVSLTVVMANRLPLEQTTRG